MSPPLCTEGRHNYELQGKLRGEGVNFKVKFLKILFSTNTNIIVVAIRLISYFYWIKYSSMFSHPPSTLYRRSWTPPDAFQTPFHTFPSPFNASPSPFNTYSLHFDASPSHFRAYHSNLTPLLRLLTPCCRDAIAPLRRSAPLRCLLTPLVRP